MWLPWDGLAHDHCLELHCTFQQLSSLPGQAPAAARGSTQHPWTCLLCSLACLQLPSIGVAQEFISFRNTTMESDKYICIRETGAQNQVVIVDMATPLAPQRRQITADSALMCPDKKVIALKATTPGTPGDALQVFNLDTKTKLKAHQMPESVEFWKWITPNMLGLVTATSVYHWDIQVRVSAPCCHSSALQRSCVLRLVQQWLPNKTATVAAAAGAL